MLGKSREGQAGRRCSWGSSSSLSTLPPKQLAEELWNLHERCGRMRSPFTRVGTQQWELCQHVKGKRNTELPRSKKTFLVSSKDKK